MTTASVSIPVRPARRAGAGLLAIVAAVLVIACCCSLTCAAVALGWAGATSLDWPGITRCDGCGVSGHERQHIERTFSAGSAPRLEVENFAGSVTVQAGEGDTIRVFATKQARRSYTTRSTAAGIGARAAAG